MNLLSDVIADFSARFGHRWSLPEYRQIELYTKKKKMGIAAADPAGVALPGTLSTSVATLLLEDFVQSRSPSFEGKTSWERYQAFPRDNTIDKLVAEVYRILRVFRAGVVQQNGKVEVNNGVIKATCTLNRTALTISLTEVGLSLLESFVYYYLQAARQPYGDAYVEAILMQYYVDIVAEIKGFADEDRVLYQFRKKYEFNRHFRFDCENATFTDHGEHYSVDIGKFHDDGIRYPIDFFVIANGVLHIIPVEALTNKTLPVADLAQWRARVEADNALPPHFRMRFAHVPVVSGYPMT